MVGKPAEHPRSAVRPIRHLAGAWTEGTCSLSQATTVTTETSLPTATTPKSTRTSRAEGSTANDLARQYAEVDGDLDDEDDEPSRILLLQLPTKPELIAKYYDLRALAK